MTPHLKRWLTGVIAIPVLIGLIGFSPRWIFYSMLYLFSALGLKEFYKLVSPELPALIVSGSLLLSFILFVSVYAGQLPVALSLIILMVLVPMVFVLFSDPRAGESNSSLIGRSIMGPVYISLPLVMIIAIDRFSSSGQSVKGLWVFFLLVVTFANDTGAFYCGKLFGKHKLYESVSPNKTIEGSAGGLIFAVLIGILFLGFSGIHAINPASIILIVVITIAGQVGDLAESMLKRNHGVKDSGGILPGHGGVLDRIDSLLFSIPVLHLYLQLISIW